MLSKGEHGPNRSVQWSGFTSCSTNLAVAYNLVRRSTESSRNITVWRIMSKRGRVVQNYSVFKDPERNNVAKPRPQFRSQCSRIPATSFPARLPP